MTYNSHAHKEHIEVVYIAWPKIVEIRYDIPLQPNDTILELKKAYTISV